MKIIKTYTLVRICRWLLRNTGWELRLRSVRPMTTLNRYAQICHEASVKSGWWHDLNTGEPLKRNHGELLMLMVSELTEGFEGLRKDLMDDKLPHRRMVEVEFADLFIRAFDYAGAAELHGVPLDLDGAVVEKMAFNAQRADHKPENRRKSGGKKF